MTHPTSPPPTQTRRRRAPWLAALLLAAAAVLGGWGWKALQPEPPERAYVRLGKAGQRGDWPAVWDGFDRDSQVQLDRLMRAELAKMPDRAEAQRLGALPAPELFAQMSRRGYGPKVFGWEWVRGVEYRPDGSAVLRVTRPGTFGGEQEGRVLMVEEDRRWRVSIERP